VAVDLAGFSVTIFSASSRGTPPYLMAFAASVFNRRASSSLSELKPTFTPRSHMMYSFHGIASITSCL